jgi:hypothetical protein
MGIEVLVFGLLSTNILVQNVGEDQYGLVRSGPPSPFQARSVRRRVSVSQPEGGPVRELDEVAWKDAPRLVSKKDAQKFHNAGRLQGIIAQGAEHTTLRAGLGIPQPNGVEQEIKMAVGARVMLRRNTGTEDGLVNGVMGTVVGFQWPEGVAVDDPERQ